MEKVSFGDDSANYYGYVSTCISPTRVYMCTSTSSGSRANAQSGTVTIPRNTWFHFVVILSGTTITAYVNNVQVYSSAGMIVPPIMVRVSNRVGFATSNYGTIGVDELKIYNRALSAGEITTDYNTAGSLFTFF
jgi:hypothetical protein